MEEKKIYCAFCNVQIVPVSDVKWHESLPYHKHHLPFKRILKIVPGKASYVVVSTRVN